MDLNVSLKAVESQLKKQQIKRDNDVSELYLGERNLTKVADLSRFQNLKYLWLNDNLLRQIECLKNNLHLCELYLQNNELVTIQGCLGHLTSLNTLFLHNNQLQKLEAVIRELGSMQHLTTLNLFHNPIAQESEYRDYVIFHIPSLTLLDRKEVLDSERVQSKAMYDQETQRVKETIAFGRRSEGPPQLYHPAEEKLTSTQPAGYEVGNNFYRNHPPHESEQHAVNSRALQRSVMQFTTMNWAQVPRAQERRTTDKAFNSPQAITTRFR